MTYIHFVVGEVTEEEEKAEEEELVLPSEAPFAKWPKRLPYIECMRPRFLPTHLFKSIVHVDSGVLIVAEPSPRRPESSPPVTSPIVSLLGRPSGRVSLSEFRKTSRRTEPMLAPKLDVSPLFQLFRALARSPTASTPPC